MNGPRPISVNFSQFTRESECDLWNNFADYVIRFTPATRSVFCSWWSSADTVNPGVVRLCLRLEVNLIKAVERATDGELLESVDSLTDNVIT